MIRFIVTLTFLSIFSVAYAQKGLQANPGHHVNWITIWLSFFFGLLFTILFRFLNRHSKTIDQRSDAGQPIAGWILFLGFNLVLRIILQIYFFWEGDYFLKSTWTYLYLSGGTGLQSLFIFEMFLSLFAITGTGALVYWFAGRRDIFPSMFVYYVGFYLVAAGSLYFIYQSMPMPDDLYSLRRNGLFQTSRIVYGMCWIIFILRSDKVKRTFVYPHS